MPSALLTHHVFHGTAHGFGLVCVRRYTVLLFEGSVETRVIVESAVQVSGLDVTAFSYGIPEKLKASLHDVLVK